MREIKFRVYDQKLAMMFDVAQLDWPHGLTIRGVKGDSGGEQYVTRGYIGKNYMDKKRFGLMQYTGLRDKNGKEIYEGDIIQYSDSINNGYRDLEVSRNAEVAFSLGVFWGGYGYNLASIRKKAEVIGNIYETPELLEGAQ